MLTRKIQQLVTFKHDFKAKQIQAFTAFKSKRHYWISEFILAVNKADLSLTLSGNKFRILWRELRDRKLWNAWTKSYLVSSVFKRCRKDRSVREILQCFRQTFLKPKRTLLLSATAACKPANEECDEQTSCDKDITDEELRCVMNDLDYIDALTKKTLYCESCRKRLVIDKKQNGITYCTCKNPKISPNAYEDGWEPYLEAEDVIIWRKEYKPGKGLYAYKVLGYFKEVDAADFAAVQLDATYRKYWDRAVAELSVVDGQANGVQGQCLVHWEVIWPRLFANRDYVYLRRHKEFTVDAHRTHDIIKSLPTVKADMSSVTVDRQRESVHTRAKRKAREMEDVEVERNSAVVENKIFVILSRSCSSDRVPVTKHAIRVTEYWSHMVVKTIEGVDKPGTIFALTYYDEPAVGAAGGAAAWAGGRAAAAFMRTMRGAAKGYRDAPIHEPAPVQEPPCEENTKEIIETVIEEKTEVETQNEPSSQVPELNQNKEIISTDRQTNDTALEPVEGKKETGEVRNGESKEAGKVENGENKDVGKVENGENKEVGKVENGENKEVGKEERKEEVIVTEEITNAVVSENVVSNVKEEDSNSEEGNEQNGGWYRYLFPFYYFM